MMMNHFAEKFAQMVPMDKEILELEEYIDCMLTTAQQLCQESGIRSVDEQMRLLALSPSVKSPLAQQFIAYQFAGRNEAKLRLKEIFGVQDETIFLRSENSITSAFLQPGMIPHWHRNDYFDVIYVFDGKCQCFFRGEKLELMEGDVLIVPPGVDHGEGVSQMQGRTMTSAIRKNTFTEVFFNVFSENQLLYSFFQRILNGNEGLDYLWFSTTEDGKKDSLIGRLFLQLWEEQQRGEKYYNKMCNALMNTIFVHLMRRYEQGLRLPQEGRINWKQEYGEILQYIAENYRSVTLKELEEKFHYSRRQLIRIIQNITGKNFTEVIRDIRLERAKMLLTETSLSVEQIAEHCGYENTSGFVRLFKKEMGKTPGQYRKKK